MRGPISKRVDDKEEEDVDGDDNDDGEEEERRGWRRRIALIEKRVRKTENKNRDWFFQSFCLCKAGTEK